MKTVVLGLFDELDTARRVLNQLAASPLDLDQISVVHGDLDTQRGLAREAGLPTNRGPLAGAVAGALVGAAVGFYAGTALAPEAVGWLLALALGAVVGALVGGTLGAMSETVRVPKIHQGEVLAAIGEGATALIVRSDSLPTARAVGDLFRVAGSRELSPLGPTPPQTDAADPSAAAEAVEPDAGVIAEPLGESFAGPVNAADFAQFAPPAEAEPTSVADASSVAAAALAPAPHATVVPPAGAARGAISAADPATAPETIFAPPWRRGVVDPADVSPAPTPPAPSLPHTATVAPPPAASFAAPASAPPPGAHDRVEIADAVTGEPEPSAPALSAPAPRDVTASSEPAAASPLAPMIAGRTATQRIARLLLDAIDEAESPTSTASTAAASTAPATSAPSATKRAPRKRAT